MSTIHAHDSCPQTTSCITKCTSCHTRLLNLWGFLVFFLSEAGKIQVYVRVRPFTEREKDKREVNAIEIHQEHSLVSRANREIGLQRVHVDTSAFRVVICHYNDLF